MSAPKRILPIIVFAQFCGTSVWFATNGIIHDLLNTYSLPASALGHLTSAIQLGFIAGTLVFAFFTIADRYSPIKVFFSCAVLAALLNAFVALPIHNLYSLLNIRFLTGFFLAGIYPVGMKIAADHFEKGLGKALGFLVGALVVGTAFPHFLKAFPAILPWKTILFAVSSLAIFGGILMLIGVPNGPYRKAGQSIKLMAVTKVFKNANFRSAAFGYFGHMWELYAFWAFVPVLLATFAKGNNIEINVSIYSFFIISIGGASCVVSGYLSQHLGVKKTAFYALLLSGICCLAAPFIMQVGSSVLFIAFLAFWGCVVIADSPLFSTLVAQNAPSEIKGSALTIVNSIGFAITIISIQLLTYLQLQYPNNWWIYTILAIGPALGIKALLNKIKFVAIE